MAIKSMLIILLSVAASFSQARDQTSLHDSYFSGQSTKPAKVIMAFHSALKSGDGKTVRSLLDDKVMIFEGAQ